MDKSPEDKGPVNLEKEYHSGGIPKRYGGESPNEELDMTLHEAFNADYTDSKGRVIVPDTIAGLTDDERELVRDDREKKAAASQARREEMAEEQAKQPHKKLWIRLGTTAAGLVIAAGGIFGINNSGHDNNAAAIGQQPTATAPAIAGATGQQTTSPETRPYQNLTIDNFPFTDSSGNVYEGVTAFQKTHELSVANYQGDNITRLMPDLINQMTGWGCSAANNQSAEAYANYTTPDGQRGLSAVGEQYDTAYAKTLSNNPAFTAMVNKMHEECLQTYLAISGGDPSFVYKSEFQATVISYARIDDVIQYDIVLSRVDNVPGASTHKPSAVRLVLKQAPGSDGRPVWKVIDMLATPHV